MKLNNIELISYNAHGADVDFVLECDFKKASALDGELLTVKSGKDTVAVFGGYHIAYLEKVNDYTRASFSKTLEPDTEQAIEALQQNQTIHAKQTVDLQEQVDELGAGLMEIATLVAEGGE